MASRALLITGATGKQGGSVIKALLEADAPFEILALTRNAQSASAQRLLKQSPKIKLVTGDFSAIDDVFRTAKEAASAPIWGVFSVQVSQITALRISSNHTNLHAQAVGKNEEPEGKRLVDAAIANQVSHFVYTSADRGVNADSDPTVVPHFITKFNIEQHLMTKTPTSNMSWSILRPVAFFDNLTPDFFGKVFGSSMEVLGKKLQMIATSDIGWFAAHAFLKADQEEYKNKSIGLAGDELNFAEMKSVFEQKTGESLPTTYAFVAKLIQWLAHDFGTMFKWFSTNGFSVDIAGLRKRNPDMQDFRTWLETESAWKKT